MVKMRFFIYTFFICLFCMSCAEDSSCVISKGNHTQKEIPLTAFSTIDIPENVEVEIVESDEYKLEIHSYENLMDNFDFHIDNHTLKIYNYNACNMLAAKKMAQLKIYTPTLEKIESRTQFKVFSTDTLRFPKLYLHTSLPQESSSTHFQILCNNQYIYVEDNQVGYFELKGKTNQLDIKLYGGNSKVEAEHLKSDTVYIFHRSNQNILVKPIFLLEGVIGSVGNVYSYHKPDSVNISRLYSGDLIYL